MAAILRLLVVVVVVLVVVVVVVVVGEGGALIMGALVEQQCACRDPTNEFSKRAGGRAGCVS